MPQKAQVGKIVAVLLDIGGFLAAVIVLYLSYIVFSTPTTLLTISYKGVTPMVTQPQAQTVEHERDDGWRVLPTRKTAVTKPTSMTIMLTVANDQPKFQVVEPDGTTRPPKPGELQNWWDGQ